MYSRVFVAHLGQGSYSFHHNLKCRYNSRELEAIRAQSFSLFPISISPLLLQDAKSIRMGYSITHIFSRCLPSQMQMGRKLTLTECKYATLSRVIRSVYPHLPLNLCQLTGSASSSDGIIPCPLL